jgi:hypothetical protein
LTSEYLLYLAAIWGELERRGEDLSDLKRGIGKYLPLIASGSVLADTVVAFAGEPATLRAVAALPPKEQERIVRGGGVGHLVKKQKRRGSGAADGVVVSAHREPVRVEDMAAVATAADLAEMCVRMIEAHPNPKDVAGRLMPEVDRIARQGPRQAAKGRWE